MYNHYYGFSETPFKLLNKLVYYKYPSQERTFNSIKKCITAHEPFLLISGEVGMGKTMLYLRLTALLKKSYTILKFDHCCLSSEEMYSNINKMINPDTDEHNTIDLETIKNKLILQRKDNKKIIMIIDDAHVLSDSLLEHIRCFSNLEFKGKKLLQIVLFAQPELSSRLATHALRQVSQRITFSVPMQRLTYNEMNFYIQEHLNNAGYASQQALFKQSSLKKIYSYSQGTPRLINQLCHKSLLSCMVRNKRTVTKRDVSSAIKEQKLITKPYNNFYFYDKKTVLALIIASSLFLIFLILFIGSGIE